jgi:vacuolar-type H+-ATPase subunit E/Vma4
MKIVSGNLDSLVSLVKKRIDDRIKEMKLSLEKETSERISRANSQAKQIRSKIIEEVNKDAERMHQEKIMTAKQEAKQMLIHAKGKLEENLRNETRNELINFVKGKRKIGELHYEDLIKSAIDKGKKKKIKFDVKKSDQGVILKAEKEELDLKVDSMMKTLRAIPIEEVLKAK